jgi:nitroimidazol reductase NimA-like FMN-containing flavoprotein (pyridoxamine 5'-phosphate oxidase superfamily)
MAGKIPEKYLDLFKGKKAFANLGTLMPDGQPQVTPVWFDYDGENLIFNSARGRQKDLMSGAIRACRSPSLTRKIPTATWRSAAG